MKKYVASFLMLLSAAVSLSSCRESSKLPEPKNESVPLIIPEINPDKSYFDFSRSSVSVNNATANNITRPQFEFVVNPSQGYSELQTVEVYKSFRRGTTFGPRVKYADLTSFPATITLDSQKALENLLPAPGAVAVLGSTANAINRIVRNDAVVFTFEYIMKDGRRIVLTPVSSDNVLLASSLINAPLAAIAVFK
ncbi:hypothetical protein [Hymenobacter daeguensis]